MTGVRRIVPLTLGWIDLPRHILVHGGSDEQLHVPVPGVLLLCDVVDLDESAGGGGFVLAFDAVNLTHNCDAEVPGGLINATAEQGAEQIRRLKRIAARRGYPLIPGHDPVAWPKLTGDLARDDL